MAEGPEIRFKNLTNVPFNLAKPNTGALCWRLVVREQNEPSAERQTAQSISGSTAADTLPGEVSQRPAGLGGRTEQVVKSAGKASCLCGSSRHLLGARRVVFQVLYKNLLLFSWGRQLQLFTACCKIIMFSEVWFGFFFLVELPSVCIPISLPSAPDSFLWITKLNVILKLDWLVLDCSSSTFTMTLKQESILRGILLSVFMVTRRTEECISIQQPLSAALNEETEQLIIF